MRFVLALLAVLALLSSPMTAVAAQAACGHDGSAAMAGMDMSAMPGMDHAGAQKAGGDPCCDHTDKHRMSKDCAQVCATSCAVAVALPSSPVSIVFVAVRAPFVPARATPTPSFEPSGPERPPKSMV
jgi:uncharacterized protein involved in copper resistance